MNMIANILSDNIINAFGFMLVHSVWQGALIAVLLAVTLLIMKNFSSQGRYIAATVALFLVITVSAITFLNHLDSSPAIVEQSAVVAVTDEASTPMQGTAAEQELNRGETASGSTGYINEILAYFEVHFPMIVTIWFLGVLAFTLKFIGGYAYAQRLKVHQTRNLPAEWDKKFRRIVKSMGITAPVVMMESALAKVPVVIGHFKPVILLPLGMITRLPKDQVETIIVHELAHVLRKDYLVNILQSVVDILFFYHPGVRWISTQVRDERENACDDIALVVTGDSVRLAKALTSLQGQLMQPAAAQAATGQGGKLVNRVYRLLNKPKTGSSFVEGFTTALVIMIMAGILFGSITASMSSEAKSKSTTVDTVKDRDEKENILSYNHKPYKREYLYLDNEGLYIVPIAIVDEDKLNRNETYILIKDEASGEILKKNTDKDFIKSGDYYICKVKLRAKDIFAGVYILKSEGVTFKGITKLSSDSTVHETLSAERIREMESRELESLERYRERVADRSPRRLSKERERELAARKAELRERLEERRSRAVERRIVSERTNAEQKNHQKRIDNLRIKLTMLQKKHQQMLEEDSSDEEQLDLRRKTKKQIKNLEHRLQKLEQQKKEYELQSRKMEEERKLIEKERKRMLEERKESAGEQERAAIEQYEREIEQKRMSERQRASERERARVRAEQAEMERERETQDIELDEQKRVEEKLRKEEKSLKKEQALLEKETKIARAEVLKAKPEKITVYTSVPEVEDEPDSPEVEPVSPDTTVVTAVSVPSVATAASAETDEAPLVYAKPKGAPAVKATVPSIATTVEPVRALPDKREKLDAIPASDDFKNYIVVWLDSNSTMMKTVANTDDEISISKKELEKIVKTLRKIAKEEEITGSGKGSYIFVGVNSIDNIYADIKSDKLSDEDERQKMIDEVKILTKEILTSPE